jgi:hypothetical protein
VGWLKPAVKIILLNVLGKTNMAKKKSKKVAKVESVFDVESICSSGISEIAEMISASCQNAVEEKAAAQIITRVQAAEKKLAGVYEMLSDRLPKVSDRILKLRKIAATADVRLAAKKAKLAKLQQEIAAMESND